jgi:hypothetical protein
VTRPTVARGRFAGGRARLESHLGSRQVARVIYGAIIGLALIVALQGYPRSAGQMIGWLLGTAVAVAFGVAFPAVFFLLAAGGVIRTGAAFALAKWGGFGLIGFYGFWAARASPARRFSGPWRKAALRD